MACCDGSTSTSQSSGTELDSIYEVEESLQPTSSTVPVVSSPVQSLSCSQMLEVERDRAEDRLKIEQTQRDSVEKLRQRNKELEQQLRDLRESQVRKLFEQPK